MCCGVGGTQGSDPVELLWLWHRLVAVAPIQPLAWVPPHFMGTAPFVPPPKKKAKEKEEKELNFRGKKRQVEILELKNRIIEIKKVIDGFNSRLATVED